MERFPIYLTLSERVAGWTRGPEAEALLRVAYQLPDHAVVVEIGSFLGSGTILLAGARKLRRNGTVHCVDPFDASGDTVSTPEYARILEPLGKTSQIEEFHHNLRKAGLASWVCAHQGSAEQVAVGWTTPIDMLFMDGDQSPRGANSAYESWAPWLKPDGVLALHNSNAREYAAEHDGNFQLRQRLLAASTHAMLEEVGSTSFLSQTR